MKQRSSFTGLSGAPTATVVGALLTVLLATLLAGLGPTAPGASAEVSAGVPAGPARAADPGLDYPQMPSECATHAEKIPTKAVVCALDGFDAERPSVLLWGDSHAWMFIPSLLEAAAGRDVNLVAVLMGSCPPMDNAVRPGDAVPPCYRSNAAGVAAATRLARSGQPLRVVLASGWERYVHARDTGDRTSYIGRMAKAMDDGTPRLVRTLKALGAEVDVVGQVPTVPTRRPACAAGDEPYACSVPRARAMPDAAATRAWVARTMRPLLGTRPTIDVTPYFCTSQVCHGSVGATLTWFDDLHLSASMAGELAPYFADSVDAVAPAPPEPEEPACTVPIICP